MEQTVEAPAIGEHKVAFHLKTEQFEGPLDLLLTLIEKRKLFIGDFALARVADDYIAHIRRMETYPMSDVANFLLVASTLVLIKSKSILPELALGAEEEEDIEDLKRRLQMYEMFRSLSQHIRTNFGKQIIFERSDRPEMIPVFAPDMRLSVAQMSRSVRDVINALPKAVELPKVTIKKVVSIEEMMGRLAERVTKTLKMSFSQFSLHERGKKPEREKRVEIVVAFLAMLELVKQGVINAAQERHFGEIDIESQKLDTPQYQ